MEITKFSILLFLLSLFTTNSFSEEYVQKNLKREHFLGGVIKLDAKVKDISFKNSRLKVKLFLSVKVKAPIVDRIRIAKNIKFSTKLRRRICILKKGPLRVCAILRDKKLCLEAKVFFLKVKKCFRIRIPRLR